MEEEIKSSNNVDSRYQAGQDMDSHSKHSNEEENLLAMDPIDRLKRNIQRAEDLKLMIRNDVDRRFIPTKSKWKKIRTLLRIKLKELNKIGVSLEDYMENEIFPSKSYSRPGSYELIEACKMGDIVLAKKLLTEDPFIIYDYDHVSFRKKP